jgi:hypothetical protein
MTDILPPFSSIKRKRRNKPTHLSKDGRLILSAGDKRKQLDRIYERDSMTCHLCGFFVRREDATPDHLRICGMGGGNRDDRDENVRLAHSWCNTKRGSLALDEFVNRGLTKPCPPKLGKPLEERGC